MTPRGTVRRGSRASSPSAEAASNPMNARMPKIAPSSSPLVSCRELAGLNGAVLLCALLEPMIVVARASITVISIAPRMTPALPDSRMSK